jgi:hypothetical protein
MTKRKAFLLVKLILFFHSNDMLLMPLSRGIAAVAASSTTSDPAEEEKNQQQQQQQDGSCASSYNPCIWTVDEENDVRHCYNQAMHADNIVEVDVPVDVVASIRKDYEQDVAPFWHTSQSTDDFCLVAPYAPGVKTWSSLVEEVRSDIRWYSVNNPATYERYLQHVQRLGLMDRIRELEWIPPQEELTVFSIFFIPRSFSKRHQFHEDWAEEVGTQVVTFLVPLSSNFTIGLAYQDNDDQVQTYNYTIGKAIGVAGGMMHSTGVGQSESQDVLLCVYIGGKNKDMWQYTQDNIADELEHYHHPFKGFIRNEFLEGRKSKCQ